MSGDRSCHCEERKKPIEERGWVVFQRKHHRSTWSGGHYTPSDYSEVKCYGCGAVWRTKAKYVDLLTDGN